MFRWSTSIGLACLLLTALMWTDACTPPPTPPTPPVIPAFPKEVRDKKCPKAFSSVSSCAGGQDDTCEIHCTAKGRNQPTNDQSASLSSLCNQSGKGILCVGPNRRVKTVAAAALETNQNQNITRIIIDSGLYTQSASFGPLKQTLTIEGMSNDPQKGVRIVVPPQPTSQYKAALVFTDVQDVIVRRLSVRNQQGNGIVVQRAGQVQLVDVRSNGSLKRGVWLREIRKSSMIKGGTFQNNGSPLMPFFGIEIEGFQQKMSITNIDVSHNASGGIYVSNTPTPKGIDPDNSHRVSVGRQAKESIRQGTSVEVKGVSIRENGPIAALQMKQKAFCQTSQTCPSDRFCENGQCHPKLSITKQGTQAIDQVLGVGLVLSGAERVSIAETSLFRNDTIGIIAYSIGTLSINHNSFERNGYRRFGKSLDYLYPALMMWDMKRAPKLTDNLVVDNAESGVALWHTSTQQLEVVFQRNHIANNGRLLSATSVPQGDGITIWSEPTGRGTKLQMEQNYLAANLRSALSVQGPVSGNVKQNELLNQRFRAAIFQEVGTATNQLEINQNVIDGARGFGLQILRGGAVIDINNNHFSNVQTIYQSGTQNPEGDAISITSLTSQARIVQNQFQQNTRADILLQEAKAFVEGSTFGATELKLFYQGARSGVQGRDSQYARDRSASPLPNRPNP